MRNTDTVNMMMLNLLDSHDTHRFLTRVKGDIDKLKSALCVLFFFVGAPSVYYGTECALEGGYDPDNRRSMPWDKPNAASEVAELIKNAGKTAFSFEVLPPLKGDGTEGIFAAIDTLAVYDPAYINVTNQREVVKFIEREGGLLERRTYRHRPGTVGISAAIMKRYGIEVVAHMICGGNSRYDIEDALIDLDF